MRCYKHALPSVAHHDWSFIDDHMHSVTHPTTIQGSESSACDHWNLQVLGRNAYHLGLLHEAVADFLQLLQQSKQSSERQLGYMKEATSVIHTYLKGSPEKGEGRR